MENNEKRILDHGYLRLVESWGSDEAIIEAARMSTQKGFLGWGPVFVCGKCGKPGEDCQDPKHDGSTVEAPGDEKLLRYLYENKHATPFEFAGIVVEVQAPIFVFREWHRHRTQSYNEMSARYAPLPNLNYVPTVERLMQSGGANRQAGTASGADVLTVNDAQEFRGRLIDSYREAEEFYQDSLKSGVPKELARVHLPVGRYSRMRASANLRNWLAFMTLRSAPTAQWEIRQYSLAVGELVAELFPRTWELFSR